MKPIRSIDRRVANIRDATAFEPYDPVTEPGTSILKLNTAMPRDVGFYIYRMEPGARSTPHRHGGAEEFVMLEGELIDNDGTVYRQGDVVWLAPGTDHVSHTETGCLIAVFSEGEETPLVG
ncbi:cupin domain-containing protein [Roseovarius sp. SK2]|jgi:anti-sigma factor ChrR (cupin superfamily)|uniref:cupin domain-containing protein n=1 Tax=Roseovarius TaxID=74030 RepID=UPI001B80E40B|nr:MULTISPECIES: cupin domain-containing protein [Roseovarius]MDD9724044.1 cupin domain-containing protein [Roseovarius sp. SK2]